MSEFLYGVVGGFILVLAAVAIIATLISARKAAVSNYWNILRAVVALFGWLIGFIPLFLAVTLSLLFIYFAWNLAHEITTQGSVQATRFSHLMSSTPNEIGDTLAGFFGTLTLVWVVASVVQQSMELRAQRHEFKEMVKAQQSQVAAFSAQTEIFLDEKRRRDESAQRELLNEKINTLCHLLNDRAFRAIRWRFANHDYGFDYDDSTLTIPLSLGLQGEQDPDAWITRHLQRWFDLPSSLKETMRQSKLAELPHRDAILGSIEKKIDELRFMYSSVSERDQERLTRISINILGYALFKLVNDPELWDEQSEHA